MKTKELIDNLKARRMMPAKKMTLSDKIFGCKYYPHKCNRKCGELWVKDVKKSIKLILDDLNEANFNSVVIDKIFKNRLGDLLI